ncbi:MAG: hydantoinase B/oxoprolinase family protein [Proteobacteria bacterium]|nr:hydantoinase B/oxoprolinase family protein [Pseudomonadota bacterium]
MNCTRPAPISVATVGAIQSVNSAACLTIGKMLDASEKYKEEATAVWHANHFAIFMFGQNQHNREAIGILTEVFAGSGGARTFADGVDLGGEIPNPISRMANVETMEASFPLRYLFRRRFIDSGGPGEFRGGTGMEFCIVPHDAPQGGIHYVVSGKGTDFPMSDGLSGGYPGAPCNYVWVRNNDAEEGDRNIDYAFAQNIDDMPGEQESVSWGVYPLLGKDALYVQWDGGGGYGDPLRRAPAAVLADLSAGTVTEAVADRVFGVVLDGGKQAVDEHATTTRRDQLRAQRLMEAAE